MIQKNRRKENETKNTSRLHGIIFLATLMVTQLFNVGWEKITGPEEPEIRKTSENVQVFWNEFDWADLYPAEQALWAVLGWSQSSWDSEDPNDWPASEEKDWADLTEEEQEAATALGYDQEYWDSV